MAFKRREESCTVMLFSRKCLGKDTGGRSSDTFGRAIRVRPAANVLPLTLLAVDSTADSLSCAFVVSCRSVSAWLDGLLLSGAGELPDAGLFLGCDV